jgi:hypothetical protein
MFQSNLATFNYFCLSHSSPLFNNDLEHVYVQNSNKEASESTSRSEKYLNKSIEEEKKGVLVKLHWPCQGQQH